MPSFIFEYDDRPILVEIANVSAPEPESKGRLQDASRLGDAAKAAAKKTVEVVQEVSDEAVQSAFNTVYKMAMHTGSLIKSLHDNPYGVDQSALASVEIEFGLKFSGGIESPVIANGEGSINVKLTWEPKPPQPNTLPEGG